MRTIIASLAWCPLMVLLLALPAGAAELSGRVEVWETQSGKLRKLSDHGNAVIFVTGFTEQPAAGKPGQLAQKNKSFSQRVLAITRGGTVEFPNLDPIHHNVWSKSKARPFDLGLYKAPEIKPVTFPKPGIITVFCNIHPQMIATILVLPNRRYAVTEPSGKYRIRGLPVGTYTVYAWVEGASPVKQRVQFARGKTTLLNFRLRLQRIPIRHMNKNGKPYKNYSN